MLTKTSSALRDRTSSASRVTRTDRRRAIEPRSAEPRDDVHPSKHSTRATATVSRPLQANGSGGRPPPHTASMELALVIDVAIKLAVVGLSVYPIFRPGISAFCRQGDGPPGSPVPGRHVAHPCDMARRRATRAISRRGRHRIRGSHSSSMGWATCWTCSRSRGSTRSSHFFGWFLLAIAFGLAVSPLLTERWVAFGLVLGFGAVVDILWEIGEYLLLAEWRVRPGPDVREHHPGPWDVARRCHGGGTRGRDGPLAGARDAGHAVRLELRSVERARSRLERNPSLTGRASSCPAPQPDLAAVVGHLDAVALRRSVDREDEPQALDVGCDASSPSAADRRHRRVGLEPWVVVSDADLAASERDVDRLGLPHRRSRLVAVPRWT